MELIEIFPGIDGEVNKFGQGVMSVFVRFARCQLACRYCDVPDKSPKMVMTPKEIFDKVRSFGISKVTITGGEPLLQDPEEMGELLETLERHEYNISLETNGTLSVGEEYLYPADSIIMDLKLPSSGEFDKTTLDNVGDLVPENDFIKFVVGNEDDYSAMMTIINQISYEYPKLLRSIAVSPMFGPANIPTISPAKLLDMMIGDRLDCYLNIQIHKLIGVK